MSMTMIIIISLLVLNLGMTLIMFWIIHDLLEATKSVQDSEDLLKKYNERVNVLYDGINLWQKNAEQSYDAICSAYKTMHDQYKLITDMHTKLLECWKGCEERYSQSYELFKHCSDNLKEVSFQLTDLANVSTEDEYSLTLNEACDTVCLDCPYDKCLTGNCPVWHIKNKDSEFLNSLADLAKEKGDDS